MKNEAVTSLMFPQYPNFCGVASCGGAANAILHIDLSQEDLHHTYGIGKYTKLKIPIGFNFAKDSFKDYQKIGMGMSNWDIVRLFNAIMLDHDKTPYSLVLAGQDFVREMKADNFANLNDWLQQEGNQAVVHIVDHYVLFAGSYEDEKSRKYMVCADPSGSKGPVNSLPLSELITLASKDRKYGRYGMILLSDTEIPSEALFSEVNENMFPKESTTRERFSRI
jgi:hypothetical protein